MIINEKSTEEIIGCITPPTRIKESLKNVLYLTFSKFDFIKLFIAYMKKEGETVIEIENLAEDLYYYHDYGFEILFGDIVKEDRKKSILELQSSIQYAKEQGLLKEKENKTESFILMPETQKGQIIRQYDIVICKRMEQLVKQYIVHKKIKKKISEGLLEEPEETISLSRCLKIREDQRKKDVQEMTNK